MALFSRFGSLRGLSLGAVSRSKCALYGGLGSNSLLQVPRLGLWYQKPLLLSPGPICDGIYPVRFDLRSPFAARLVPLVEPCWKSVHQAAMMGFEDFVAIFSRMVLPSVTNSRQFRAVFRSLVLGPIVWDSRTAF
jgi:hypothetical protein